MRLIELQWKFMRMIPRLIDEAHRLGYECTAGDMYRDPRVPYGHEKSLHKQRLAFDLNLFRDGKYITNDEGHRELHVFWAGIGGAPMIRNDQNHYSVEFDGVI